MSNNRYTTPEKSTIDWHIPLNKNFEQLDRDVEFRDVEATLGEYRAVDGAKFFATDTGAVHVADGDSWKLVGYVSRAVSGNIGHFVNYADGLENEPVNTFLLDSAERLEVTRLSFPIKGAENDSTVPEAVLRVYEGEDLIVEIEGNSFKSATADSTRWVATGSAVTVTVTNSTGDPIAAIPKVWANIRGDAV